MRLCDLSFCVVHQLWLFPPLHSVSWVLAWFYWKLLKVVHLIVGVTCKRSLLKNHEFRNPFATHCLHENVSCNNLPLFSLCITVQTIISSFKACMCSEIDKEGIFCSIVEVSTRIQPPADGKVCSVIWIERKKCWRTDFFTGKKLHSKLMNACCFFRATLNGTLWFQQLDGTAVHRSKIRLELGAHDAAGRESLLMNHTDGEELRQLNGVKHTPTSPLTV